MNISRQNSSQVRYFLFLMLFCLCPRLHSIEKSTPPPTIQKLQNSIKAQSQLSTSDLTEKILKIFPKNLTFLKNSHALIGANEKYPRPIVWDESEGVVLTWKIHTENSGPSDIEYFYYDQMTKKLKLERITENDWANGKSNSEQPSECLKCHGPHSKPIWSEYPIWPEAFGEDDDRLNQFDAQFWNKNNSPSMEKIRNAFQFENYFRPYSDLDTKEKTFLHQRPNMRLGVLLNQMNTQFVFDHFIDKISDAEKINLLSSALKCEIGNSLKLNLKKTGINWTDINISQIHFADESESILRPWMEYYHDGASEFPEYLVSQLVKDQFPTIDQHQYTQTMATKYPLISDWNLNYANDHIMDFSQRLSWVYLPFYINERTRQLRKNSKNITDSEILNLLCQRILLSQKNNNPNQGDEK